MSWAALGGVLMGQVSQGRAVNRFFGNGFGSIWRNRPQLGSIHRRRAAQGAVRDLRHSGAHTLTQLRPGGVVSVTLPESVEDSLVR